ncbi:hypothetical protein SAMN04515691_0985 [Leifsonia sp. 98AMF]|uniref:hypothetical protein n=1 Tax=unclassified Leifsonia TaxID=2663824 RepID=UPI00087DAE43|nr:MULTISPECIES: hypothetical protein [unclassified Leifsonia]SDH55372.1 hypothetical protein SAMN04515690_3035 [Leifsonia sp. 197AMF]SDI83344.1 hypothetical protein SAMN04515684_0753 [Leifsonia sp. 466MF]SDK00313.1 hypothetical protein SAMN04515683_1996 [Leifsonia sp. 157MF]SDN86585.1 hypothetical protein SAMN04515686_2955 [Leifsonia sp. 509MF]SEN20854.1 hypothetical protein SAMN04515685_2031 [Leifsonia sp. 467MF]
MQKTTRPSSAGAAMAIVLSVLAVFIGGVLTAAIAVLDMGVAACGPATDCDYGALWVVGLITPSTTVAGVLVILVMIYRLGRSRRVWWIPLPVIGGIVVAFLVSAAITAELLP